MLLVRLFLYLQLGDFYSVFIFNQTDFVNKKNLLRGLEKIKFIILVIKIEGPPFHLLFQISPVDKSSSEHEFFFRQDNRENITTKTYINADMLVLEIKELCNSLIFSDMG